ncbi:MAG: ThiF family adenylyltransferase [bacterium]
MEENIIIQDVEKERYASFSFIPWWDQEKIKKSRVLVVGAGALGNEVLKNLALIGIGNIFIIDYDKIVNADLTRSVLYRQEDEGKDKVSIASERVRQINPDVRVQYLHGDVVWDIGLGLFRRMDIIIGCVDNREARLSINQACWKVNKPWIDGGIDVLNGVVSVFIPGQGACYECTLTDMDYKILGAKYSCPLLRYSDLVSGKVPTTPTTAAIIAGLQVQETLKLIHKMDVPSGKGIIYNGFTYEAYLVEYAEKKNCLSHERYQPIIEITRGSSITFRQLLDIAKDYLGEGAHLELDRDIIWKLECKGCEYQKLLLRVLGKVTLEEGSCPECNQPCHLEMKHIITREDKELLDITIAQTGLPELYVIAVRNGEEICYLELSDSSVVL